MSADRKRIDKAAKEHVDKMLDEALEETFPASDPVAITQPVYGAKVPVENLQID